MSYYGSLCTQMYDLDKPNAPEEALNFYLSYAFDRNISILEPMCGSGRFLIPFLERGYSIDGFDISDDMLKACMNKAKKMNLDCKVKRIKIEKFVTDKEYDLIITPDGSFGVVTDEDKVFKGLSNLYNCLKPTGKLVLEILTTALKVEPSNNWIVTNRKNREDGKTIIQSGKTEYNDENKIVKYPLRYDLVDGDAILETEYMDLYLKLYEVNDFKSILEKVGFKVLKIIKAFEDKLPSDEDEVVVYECTRGYVD